jgi:hypothetical protein
MGAETDVATGAPEIDGGTADPPPGCANGVIDPGEACDGDELGLRM